MAWHWCCFAYRHFTNTWFILTLFLKWFHSSFPRRTMVRRAPHHRVPSPPRVTPEVLQTVALQCILCEARDAPSLHNGPGAKKIRSDAKHDEHRFSPTVPLHDTMFTAGVLCNTSGKKNASFFFTSSSLGAKQHLVPSSATCTCVRSAKPFFHLLFYIEDVQPQVHRVQANAIDLCSLHQRCIRALHLIESLKCTWSHPGMHRRCKERCKERCTGT